MENIQILLRRIEDYQFQCDAGDLQHCQEWRDLKYCLNELNSYLPEDQQLDIV